MGILLTPYNDSMRLGQGYNSFLQSPCMYGAVEVPTPRIQNSGLGLNTSQTVSYSSHVVNRISDVTRSMGVSTGSSIKNGSIAMSGNASSIDETKFAESHMNVILSVKVVNQTIELNHTAKFKTVDADNLVSSNKPNTAEKAMKDSQSFHETFGDCYISGFIEGGDLHSVVSIKVLDSTKKEEVKARITRDMNNSGPAGFTFDPSHSYGTLGSGSSECETTITVNWSGGGRVKSDDEEWSLESLQRVAAAFPAKVALCPQKTWAILTPYNNNRQFVEWAIKNGIKAYDYSGINTYASDLLDTYMVYKNNIRRIQSVLANPNGYLLGPASKPINIDVTELVDARKQIREEMAKIMDVVDKLNNNPMELGKMIETSQISSPELWATRLPIPRGTSAESQAALKQFAKLDSDVVYADMKQQGGPRLNSGLGRPHDAPADKLYGDNAMLKQEEKEALDAGLNRRILANYRFDATRVSKSTSAGETVVATKQLGNELRMNAVFSSKFGWPSILRMNISGEPGKPIFNFRFSFGEEPAVVFGDQEALSAGPNKAVLQLEANERITKVRIGKTTVRGEESISYVHIKTTDKPDTFVGEQPINASDIQDFNKPADCSGLVFFLATAKHGDAGMVGRLILAWK